MQQARVVVLGGAGTGACGAELGARRVPQAAPCAGKTALIQRITADTFPQEYKRA